VIKIEKVITYRPLPLDFFSDHFNEPYNSSKYVNVSLKINFLCISLERIRIPNKFIPYSTLAESVLYRSMVVKGRGEVLDCLRHYVIRKHTYRQSTSFVSGNSLKELRYQGWKQEGNTE